MKQSLFVLLVLCLVACVTPKKVMRSSYVDSLDNLLSTPTLNPTQELVYRKYTENRKDYVLDTFSVQTRTYNYNGIDSILQLMTLYPDAWSVQQLEEVYGRFEIEFFKTYSDYLSIYVYGETNRINGHHENLLRPIINIILNIDYLIYAKKRYAGKNFKQSYEIFKEECKLRKMFQVSLFKERETVRDALDSIHYFTSSGFRYQLLEYRITLFPPKFTMLDRFVKKKTDFLIEESESLYGKPDLWKDFEYRYVYEVGDRIIGNWGVLMAATFDDYLVYKLCNTENFYNRLFLNNLFTRADEKSIQQFYLHDTRSNLPQDKYAYTPAFGHYEAYTTPESFEMIKDLYKVDLVNYCSLDSLTKRNIWLMGQIKWNDKQIDSLIQIRETQPCDD